MPKSQNHRFPSDFPINVTNSLLFSPLHATHPINIIISPNTTAAIPGFLASSLGSETGYPKVFCGFPQSFRATTGKVLQNLPQLLPFTSFSIHHSQNCPIIRCYTT
jgi:hypothetical protein